jgi:hypothetical protein
MVDRSGWMMWGNKKQLQIKFINRKEWIAPFTLAVSSVLILIWFTFGHPVVWLRVVIDLGFITSLHPYRFNSKLQLHLCNHVYIHRKTRRTKWIIRLFK